MNAYSVLSFIQNNYEFSRANSILSETNLKNCWKQWLTAELVHMFNGAEQFERIQIDSYYPGSPTEDQGKAYLRYKIGKPVEHVAKKNSASRSDFSLKEQSNHHFFEIRCGNYQTIEIKKDIVKYESDMTRIEQIKNTNPDLNPLAVFAFYGSLSALDIKSFTLLDNNKRCTYVLDTNLSGSSSISRLTQMIIDGKPRLCLAAYTVS